MIPHASTECVFMVSLAFKNLVYSAGTCSNDGLYETVYKHLSGAVLLVGRNYKR